MPGGLHARLCYAFFVYLLITSEGRNITPTYTPEAQSATEFKRVKGNQIKFCSSIKSRSTHSELRIVAKCDIYDCFDICSCLDSTLSGLRRLDSLLFDPYLVMIVSVCLTFARLSQKSSLNSTKFSVRINCMCPWLGSPLAELRYVMYFRCCE